MGKGLIFTEYRPYWKFSLQTLSHLSSSSTHPYFGFYHIVLSLLSNHLATPINPGRTQDESFRRLYLNLSGLGHYLRLLPLSLRAVGPLAVGVDSESLPPTSIPKSQYYFNFVPFTGVFKHSTF